MEHIICGGGASDLIFRIALTVKPRRALVLAPTFSDYERALRAAGSEVHYHMLYESGGFETGPDILDTLAAGRYELMYICSPNNPTGCVMPPELVRRLAARCREMNCVLAADECFLDFLPESSADEAGLTAKPLTRQVPGLVVLKAFTKVFARPGVRLGYAICGDLELLASLYAHGADWSVSAPAQAAGIAALKNPMPYLEASRNFIETEKAELIGALRASGLQVYGSRANYVFFKCPYETDLQAELRGNFNIYIRSCGNYIGLDGSFYRAGISSRENNRKLREALGEIWRKLWQK
jgi:threonine-phosphate decarboxylase